MKWPAPRPVAFSPDTSSMIELASRWSPGHQRTHVVLVAVGGHHGGEPGLVEQAHQVVAGRVGAHLAGGAGPVGLQRGTQSAHDPGLEHGGRGDDARKSGVTCRVVVDVHRVVVAHGLHPVPDHRQVDRILSPCGHPGGHPHERLQLVVEGRPAGGRSGCSWRCRRRAHRDDRFIPRPAMARISRWTSLTPPPKVLIWAWRPARSSSPWSTAPGDPGLR